ncbi:MAG TPA: hypothetical protein P5055_08515, partial [Candidatus Paceibacterota bacterium]|nr:hypothetical protein [Candidatus Paceibacterota bacterium]
MSAKPDSTIGGCRDSLAAPPSSTTADEDIPPTFSRSDDPEAEAPQTPDTARAMLWPALGFSA